MGRPGADGDVEGGPEGHGGDEGENGAHGLNPEAGEDLPAHEMGKAGGHSTGWAGKAGPRFKLTFLETELAVGTQAIGAGLKLCGDKEDGEAGEGDGKGHKPRVEGEAVLRL